MGTDSNYFPNAEAWVANMSNVRSDFKKSFPRGGGVVRSPENQIDAEYKKFAQMDLGGIF